MVIGNSSQQPGLEQDDPSGFRAVQNSDVTGVPPPNVIRVWQEVALGIDRSQTGKRRIEQLRVSALGFLDFWVFYSCRKNFHVQLQVMS